MELDLRDGFSGGWRNGFKSRHTDSKIRERERESHQEEITHCLHCDFSPVAQFWNCVLPNGNVIKLSCFKLAVFVEVYHRSNRKYVQLAGTGAKPSPESSRWPVTWSL